MPACPEALSEILFYKMINKEKVNNVPAKPSFRLRFSISTFDDEFGELPFNVCLEYE